MRNLVDDDISFAVQLYKVLMKNVPADVMPRSYDASKDSVITSNTKWWSSGFYPSTLWMIYNATKDSVLRKEAENRLAILEKEKNYSMFFIYNVRRQHMIPLFLRYRFNTINRKLKKIISNFRNDSCYRFAFMPAQAAGVRVGLII